MQIQIEQWFLNTETGSLSKFKNSTSEENVRLDNASLELLLCLIRYRGENVTKEVMLTEAWPNKIVSDDVLSVAMSQIRKALGDDARKPTFIKTIPTVGYKLIANVTEINNVEPSGKNNGKYLSRNMVTISLVILTSFLIVILTFNYLNPEPLPTMEVNDDYQKARYLLTKKDKKSWQQALQLFEETIINTPNYAPAYLDLVKTKFKLLNDSPLEKFEKSSEFKYLLNKSLSLAPNQPQAYKLLAHVAFYVDWNFTLANTYFDKALELAPNDVVLHAEYAQYLLAIGDFSSAIEHVDIYKAAEPSTYSVPTVAWIYRMMEELDVALAELEKLNDLSPNSRAYHVTAQAIYEDMGKENKAFIELIKIFKILNYSESELMKVHEVFREKSLAGVYLWLLHDKKEQNDIGHYQPPLSYARYAIKAGRDDLAKKYIQQALTQKQIELLWFNADPIYKSIRENTEFKNIINPT